MENTLPIIQTTDNNLNNPYQLSDAEIEAHKQNLEWLSGKPIGKLSTEENPNLLVFPQCLNDYKDGIDKQYIFTIRNNTIYTSNIMGFVGKGDTRLRIYSRFAKDDGQDWFLHYMLQKVFHINLFDLQYGNNRDEIFDFLMYLFPAYLNRAYRQGLYKEYLTFSHNDAHIRGRIDIARHIRQNIPFTGKVAYQTRKYTYNNAITQLIRHTIEYIRAQSLYAPILRNNSETKDAVSAIVQATPNYNRQERQRIIHQNLRPIRHPYYSEYRQLQQLCLQILRHKELKYSNTNDQIYGILFDGAWLWEEYLAIVLKDKMTHYTQSRPKKKYLFTNKTQQIVPDFLNPQWNIVGDAKYIPLDTKHIKADSESALAIYYKTVMYMYRFDCPTGYLFYPYSNGENMKVETLYIDNEDKNTLIKVGMPIPQSINDWNEFVKKMKESESKLVNQLKTTNDAK